MNRSGTARIAAGVILAAMLLGSVGTAGASMMDGTYPGTAPDGGWVGPTPSTVCTPSVVSTPSLVCTPPVGVPSTDATSWVCPGPGSSVGATPSIPTSPAPWPMPHVGGTAPSQGTTVTIGCGVGRVMMPRAFVLSGILASGKMGDPVVVEVMKPGTTRWSYSSMRLVYSQSGDWWYRYTPKMRGTYRFRSRAAGVAVSSASPMSRTISVAVK